MTISLRSIVLTAACVMYAAAAGAQRGPVPPNAPPTVTAYCDPCTVEIGKTSTIHAYAKDPNRKPLTIHWTAKAGTIADAAGRETVWTAPAQEGNVDVTVTVDNGTGGTASNTVTIVVRPAQ